MNDIDPAHELRAALAEAALPAAGSQNEARDARMQAWLRSRVAELPLQARRRRRRRVALASGALTLSAAAAFALLSTRGVEPSARGTLATWQAELESGAELSWRDAQGQTHELRRDSALRAPGVVSVGQAGANLTSPLGVRLKLKAGTALRTPSRTAIPGRSEVTLERGEVDVQVPPLGTTRSFAVYAGDSEVIVHGTRFVVALRDGRTCVRVSEGLVEVRGTGEPVFLGPSEQRGCDAAEDDSRVAPDSAARPRRVARRGPRRQQARRPSVHTDEDAEASAAVAATSSLNEQNALLSEGLSAELKGDRAAATRALRQLLQRHPESPLAPEARRALTRLAAPGSAAPRD